MSMVLVSPSNSNAISNCNKSCYVNEHNLVRNYVIISTLTLLVWAFENSIILLLNILKLIVQFKELAS